MTANEAHKAQWQALKDKPLGHKLKYIFTYYWPGILGCVCVIAFLVSWISGALSQKQHALSGYLLNGFTNSSYTGDFTQEFMDHQQIDSNEYSFKLTSDMTYSTTEISDTATAVLESIIVQIYAQELDFIIVDLENCPVLSAYYTDLRSVLTEEQIEKWQNYFIYVEKDELEMLTSGSLDQIVLPTYYSSTEGLQDPIPLGIRLSKDSKLFDAYSYASEDVFFGLTASIQNIENTLAFLEYIID